MASKSRKFANLDDYLLIKLLGSGYNCKVKLGYQETTKKYFAIKIIRNRVHVDSNMKALLNEIQLLTKMSNENIINLHKFSEEGVYCKKNGKTYKTKYVALELASNGELFGYISTSGCLDERICRAYFHQLINALDYCHKNGVAHRDLKPENLLLDDKFNLKVSDFGFSTFYSRELSSHVGTKLYMAPEMHFENPYYGASIDLFATGIILFTMFTGLQPFENSATQKDSFYRMFYTNNMTSYWETVSKYMPKQKGKIYEFPEEFKQIIGGLLAVDATQRPSIAEIRNMAWYNGDVATKEEVFAEMNRRKIKVEEDNERQRLEKIVEKQKKKIEEESIFSKKSPHHYDKLVNQPQIGKNVHRDNLIGTEKSEENIEKYRELYEFNSLEDQLALGKNCLDFMTSSSPQEVFVTLYEWMKLKCNEVTIDENYYKVKGKIVKEMDVLEFAVKFWKLKEDTISLEFCKKEGPSLIFYNIAKEIKDNLNKVF